MMSPDARALALLLILACNGDRQAPVPSSTSTPPAPSQADSAAGDSAAEGAADSAVWLTRERALDFTGDGMADTVRLSALGRAADSLRIALTFWSGGAERWREEWGSAYELMVPTPPADEAARAGYLRERLDRALGSVRVEPFDSSDYVTMADPVDSGILRRPPSQQVSFAYGFETTVVLAWDPATAKLRRLHACC